MLSKGVIATFGMLAGLTASAWAGTIQDPAAWLDQGSGSQAFNGSGSFTMPSNGILALYNNTGELLTSITLNVTVDTGLSQSDFQCSDLTSQDGGGFFQKCTVNYDSGTGALTMAFAGVVPYQPPASSSGADLVGDDMGIPPLLSNCTPTVGDPGRPDSNGCTDVGHFAFNFLDDNLQGGDNGWPGANGGNFPTVGVVSTEGPVPEPGTSGLLVAGLVGLSLLSRRNYFSRNIRS